MLKTKYLSKKAPQKAEIAARDEQAPETTKRHPQRIQNTVLCLSLEDIHYYSTKGTKGEVEAFDCDKSANLMPKNVKKVEIWPKRHPKCECTRVWKCKMTVCGTIPSVVDPQDTNCNFCSGLRQPGADTVRKTCDFWHFRAEKVH